MKAKTFKITRIGEGYKVELPSPYAVHYVDNRSQLRELIAAYDRENRLREDGKNLWEIAAEQYKYNVNDMFGDYVGSADTLPEAESIKADYEAETGIEAYVFDNSEDYSGRSIKRGDKHE